MLCLDPDSRYADIMELALYNTVLAGMALDGKSFFYVNPLEVIPGNCKKDERKMHIKPVRQKWFGCACCPPNIARLISSLGQYIFTEDEDTLYTNLYIGSETVKSIGGKDVKVSITSGLPNSGNVSIEVTGADNTDFVLALRIPAWTEGKYEMTGAENLTTEIRNGYIFCSGFETTAKIELEFDMTARVIAADPKVTEDAGKVAIMRGPVVYCAEEADNGPALSEFRIKTPVQISEKTTSEFGTEAVKLVVKASRISPMGSKISSTNLYMNFEGFSSEPSDLTLIPYHLWANRGEGEMSVYVRVEG